MRKFGCAESSETEFDTYRAIVISDRRRVPVDVDASSSAPLVGTALLADCEMKGQRRPDGKVTIKPFA